MVINCTFNSGVEIAPGELYSNFLITPHKIENIIFFLTRSVISCLVIVFAFMSCLRAFNKNAGILILPLIVLSILTAFLLVVVYFAKSSYYDTRISCKFFTLLFLCLLTFDKSNKFVGIFFWPISISVFLLFTFTFSRIYNTKVQFICNFMYEDLGIIGIRLLDRGDFVEYYEFTGSDIRKVEDDELNNSIIKITQKDGQVNIQFFRSGVEVNEINSWKFWRENGIINKNIVKITPNDIEIYHNMDKYGSLTISEAYVWFISLLFNNNEARISIYQWFVSLFYKNADIKISEICQSFVSLFSKNEIGDFKSSKIYQWYVSLFSKNEIVDVKDQQQIDCNKEKQSNSETSEIKSKESETKSIEGETESMETKTIETEKKI